MNIPTIPNDINSQELTMNSREIAHLCEKRHDHVMRDIRKMLEDINAPKSGVVDLLCEYKDIKGENRSEFRLPKDLTLTLITGYRADLRYKVIKRVEQLEAEKANGGFQIPQNYPDALRLAADQEEQIQALTPKAEAFDRIEASEGALTPRPASKVLEYPERKLTKWLEQHHWAFRQSGKGPLQAYSDKRKAGLLDHRVSTFECKRTGEEKSSIQMLITTKGLTKLAELLPA